MVRPSSHNSSFAVLLVSDFSLQSLLRIQPELTGRPVALLDGDHRGAVITALTPAARTVGVAPGLTAPQALSCCGDLRLRQPHAGSENEASAALLAAAGTLSPRVEHTGPGVATADVTGLPTDQRQPRLAAAIHRLAGLGLTATAGLAPTPLLALYAARTATASNRKRHSRRRDAPPPAAIVSVTDTDTRAFLDPLPLIAAEPEPAHVEILTLWGIHTLGQLTALPKADVAQRLGPGGLALWERAAGQSARPLQPLSPPLSFATEMTLEHMIESLEPLLFLLRRLVDRLCLDLSGRALAAAALDLCLRLDDDRLHQRSIRLPEPTVDPELLWRTLQSHLETVTTESPVVAVRLELQPTRPPLRQHSLFDPSLRDPHGFAETLARAAALLGSDHVGTPQLANTHRPDAVTLTSPATAVDQGWSAAVPFAETRTGLPLRRYRPPRPARVELGPSSRRPAHIRTAQLSGDIRAVQGPWRSSGDWWQPDQAWNREEWDIALADRGLYRLTATPAGWYLDGEYD